MGRRGDPLLAVIRSKRGLALLAVLGCAAPRVPAPAPAERYDIIIAGGTVIDGTGAPRYRADVAVRGDRIVRVSREPLPRDGAARVVDAAGRVVAPGFIDLHAHLEPLLEMPDAESHVRQGVTTALGGPDGGGPWPLGAYLDSVARAGVGMNVAYLVGHNTIRREVMGMADRAPTPAELERMRGMVARAMGEGAFGLSTGLRYLPGTFATTDEVVALAQAAADSGGIYTSHLREEGLGLFAGVAEAIEIGRRARIPIVLTHHKSVGQRMWGQSVRTLAMVDSARAGTSGAPAAGGRVPTEGGRLVVGVDVMLDQYPYTATHTGISVLIPSWALAGGDSAFARRVRDPTLKDSITKGIVFNILNDRGGGDLRRVQFSRVAWQRELEGKTLYDWAVMRGVAATPERGAELVIEAELRGGANAIYHVLDEGDVERIMRHPQTMIASDGRLSRPGDGHPHPRAYGTFPRVLGRYVRERRVLTLEDAVRKMTAMPAARLGLRDRGRIAEGMAADLTIFDPAAVADRATFEQPHQYPQGIDYVIVNGAVAVDAGRFTGERGGRVLKRQASGSSGQASRLSRSPR
jgi:N-acyl-D-amino-acid deacylase